MSHTRSAAVRGSPTHWACGGAQEGCPLRRRPGGSRPVCARAEGVCPPDGAVLSAPPAKKKKAGGRRYTRATTKHPSTKSRLLHRYPLWPREGGPLEPVSQCQPSDWAPVAGPTRSFS